MPDDFPDVTDPNEPELPYEPINAQETEIKEF